MLWVAPSSEDQQRPDQTTNLTLRWQRERLEEEQEERKKGKKERKKKRRRRRR